VLGIRNTWTGSRNYMLAWVKRQQQTQGWRWAFLHFGDGDVRVECPRYSTTKSIHYYAEFTALAAMDGAAVGSERLCWIAYDAMLLLMAPAVAFTSFGGWFRPLVFGMEAQYSFAFDGMFNSFQADAVDVVLPYCTSMDGISWWASQFLLVHRATCLHGHVLEYNDVAVKQSEQKHREYTRGDNSSLADVLDKLDATLPAINVVPAPLQVLHDTWLTRQAPGPYGTLMGAISPIRPLSAYGGWHKGMLIPECGGTVEPSTCMWT